MTKTFKQIEQLNPRSLMLVDTLNLAFRYKHAKAVDFCDKYMETVSSLQRSYNCDKLVMCADFGSSSYRKRIYPLYKANRAAKYVDQTQAEREEFDIFLQEVEIIIAKYIEQGKYPVARFKGVEADDLAGYVVRYKKRYDIDTIWLMSSDKDWDLLIQPGVNRFSYTTRQEVTHDNWSEHYSYIQEHHISIKCIQGDPGDNVLGVPGIGPVKAKQLIEKYGSAYDLALNLPIDSKYVYIQNLNKFGAENIELNYKLMDLLEYCDEAIGEENCIILDKQLKEYLNND